MEPLAMAAVAVALLAVGWLYFASRPRPPIVGVREAPLFRGLQLRVDRPGFSWAEGAASDWASEKPYRPYPQLVAHVSYALEPAELRQSGVLVPAALDRIALRVVEPGGREWPAHSVVELQRGAFFARTGLHPSWAERPLPPDDGGNELLFGELQADVGYTIPRPDKPVVLELMASIGSYRSNVVKLEVRP